MLKTEPILQSVLTTTYHNVETNILPLGGKFIIPLVANNNSFPTTVNSM